MNGILTATYPARVTGSSTVISLRHSTTIDWTEGDEVTVREDHYGNTYVTVDGVDHWYGSLERTGEETWHRTGLEARIAYLDEILDRVGDKPDSDPEILARWRTDRDAAAAALASLDTASV